MNIDYDLDANFDTIYEQNGEVRINCPFCEDDSGFHLYINPSKGVYHCFRCDRKGTYRQFIHEFKLKPINVTHKEFKHVDIKEKLLGKTETIPQVTLEDFKPMQVSSSMVHNPFYQYMKKRGLSIADIHYYKIHYAMNGHYRYRVIIPCFERQEFVYFTARTILNNADKRYLNPPKGVTRYTRAETVFNIDNIKAGERCVIMEGALNAMICGRDAVASFGKFVTFEQVSKLIHKHCSEYVIALDSDALSEAYDLARQLIHAGQTVRLAEFPEGKDAADLGREATREIIEHSRLLTYALIDLELIERRMNGSNRH